MLLDAHAHLVPDIAPRQLELLNASVIAVTRTFDEFRKVAQRKDATTIWALGCHPGLAKAQRGFSPDAFADLLRTAAAVGEIGLDAASRVPLSLQRTVLNSILGTLVHAPRIVSIHSAGATEAVLDALSEYPVRGVILHWWLGDARETRRAVDLGAHFSVNASSVRRLDVLSHIPSDRVLTETDHPHGDRWSRGPKRPGAVGDVEMALARHYGLAPDAMRQRIWETFTDVVDQTESRSLFPYEIRSLLLSGP